jgi:RNA polymerase sigma factor (sigma-70 family)
MNTDDSALNRSVPAWGEEFAGILDAAKAGAEWAWVELYDKLSPIVLGYLRGRAGADAEDLLGETFLHAVRSVSSFEGEERAFRTWLLGIAHHRLVDDVRYRARRPMIPVDDNSVFERNVPVGNTEDEAIDTLESRRVLEEIQRLSPDQQDVLLLRLVAGLTLQEVAEALGKRLTAVKSLQRRGLATLRKRISVQGVSR